MSSIKKRSAKKDKRKQKLQGLKIKKSYLSHRWQDWLVIAGLTLICYFPIFQNDFVGFDDRSLIVENPIVVDGNFTAGLTWGRYTPYYKPVVFTSWIIEKKLFGFNPVVFHFNNLLLHLVNCFLIYLIILQLCRFWSVTEKHSYTVAFFTALLFGLHPLHVESVAWAVERKDVLFSAFFLTGFWTYLKFTEEKKIKWMLMTAVAYLLSMMCKAPGITLIAVLFVYDFLAKRDFKWQLLVEKIPVILVFITGIWMYGLLTNYDVHTHTLATNTALENGGQPIQTTGSITGFLLMNFKMWFWLLHSILPLKLSVAYPRTEFLEIAESLKIILPVLTLTLFYLIYKSLNHNRLFFFFASFFIITLAPPLVRSDWGIGIFLSDRYTYLPSLAVIFIMVSGLIWLGNKYFSNIKQFIPLCISLVGGFFLFSGFQATKVWKNSETLWSNVVEKYPTVDYAYTNRSKSYLSQNKAEKALSDLNKAIGLNPKDDSALVERARAYRMLGKTNEALKDLNLTIQLNPENLTAYSNRGNIFQDLNKLNDALNDYNKVLSSEPNNLSTLSNRGGSYGRLGQKAKALEDLNKVIAIDPGFKNAYNNKIFVHYDAGELVLALENANLYLNLDPNDHEIYEIRGIIQQRMGKLNEAIQDFTTAIQLAPQVGRYYQSRAGAYQSLNRPDLANPDLAKANELGR